LPPRKESIVTELRRYQRTPIDEDITFNDSDGGAHAGLARDISLGGMFIATRSPLPFGAPLTVVIRLRGQSESMKLPAIARWTRTDGMGVQFGNLGARETHVITEACRTDD
jgi:PilZ domain